MSWFPNQYDEHEKEHLEEFHRQTKKPKQYQIGIDTFTRMRANMSNEKVIAATVVTVDAYIWRDKGSDIEDLKKARDWLDECISIVEERENVK